MVNTRRIFITAVLLLLISVPTSAYTLVNEYELNYSSSITSVVSLVWDSPINRTNITRLEFSGVCRPNDVRFQNDFSAIIRILSGSVTYATGNLTYDISESNAEIGSYYPCNINYNFIQTGGADLVTNVAFYENKSTVFNWGSTLGLYINKTSTTVAAPYVYLRSTSGNAAGHYKLYTGTGMEAPIAGFTGSPLSGAAPQMITLTDSSTGPGTAWNWSGTGPGTMFWSHTDTQNTTVYLDSAGNYTITHCAENALGSDCITKTDYISLHNDTSLSTTGCLAVNGATGQRIGGAQVDLYDIENSTWSNTTTTEGLGIIKTLKGHTINCYASALGFADGDLLAQPEKDQQFYTLQLWPSVAYRNVSAGYVTLYLTVTDLDTGNPIAGATVSGGGNNYGVLANSSAFSVTTNAQGMASVPVPNNTMLYLTSYKSGYNTQTAAVHTGTGSGGDARVTHWFKLSKGAITVVPSMTTLPGGGYPTTQRTIDPAGTPDPAGGSSAYSSAKGQQMMDYLAMNGMDLVQLCFLVTVLGLLGIKLGK